MKFFQKIFFFLTMAFFIAAIFSMTIGQVLPIEFADWRNMHNYYDYVTQGFPIVVLLTLVWTIKKSNTKKRNITIVLITIIGFVGSFFYMIFLMFSLGFGAWVNETILFRNKDNPEKTINRQIWDIGALGYGRRRTVELTPFLGYWNIVKEVDIATIDRTKWDFVNEGDNK